MPYYSKESLSRLNEQIDLIEVLKPFIELKRSGATYKGICPFHDENTPSFTVQKGRRHYHCFGCGAHGDAIQFLMNQQSLSFREAVESLAEQFHVPLEITESQERREGPPLQELYRALEEACRFYHFYLLHTPEGKEGMDYLLQRGFSLDCIHRFRLGYAPRTPHFFQEAMREKKISKESLEHAGLLRKGGRDFFQERITFPVLHPQGKVIGFSARKHKEETFGGKYINTPETTLFKKSRILFGFYESRRRIAKERRAIVVEGQVDALHLIDSGLDIAVAGQGTAFGEHHIKELLRLGIERVFLAFDGDPAGQEAACRVGHLFQSEGVGVFVLPFAEKMDPDLYLREYGKEKFCQLMEQSVDYVPFLTGKVSAQFDLSTSAGKSRCVKALRKQIASWGDPVMVHESLKVVATLLKVPFESVGIGERSRPSFLNRSVKGELLNINPDRIMEMDFLRALFLFGASGSDAFAFAKANICPDDLRDPVCKKFYVKYLEKDGVYDTLQFVNEPEEQALFEEIFLKKVKVTNPEKAKRDAMLRILERNWMEKREKIAEKIKCDPEREIEWIAEFNELMRFPPSLTTP